MGDVGGDGRLTEHSARLLPHGNNNNWNESLQNWFWSENEKRSIVREKEMRREIIL